MSPGVSADLRAYWTRKGRRLLQVAGQWGLYLRHPAESPAKERVFDLNPLGAGNSRERTGKPTNDP